MKIKQRLYGCRKEACGLKYTLPRKRNCQKKTAGQMPSERRDVNYLSAPFLIVK